MNRHFFVSAIASGLLMACAVTPDCRPSGQFEQGLAGASLAQSCPDEAANSAYQLGLQLHESRSEREQVQTDLDRAEAGDPDFSESERRRLLVRLRVLDRDIPELETLARSRGLMAPASLPE